MHMFMLTSACCSNRSAQQHLAARRVQPMPMERFVRRWDGQIVEDEFQVAKALLESEPELLSQEVDSKHLFGFCLHFGHQSTAAALMSYGVPGCRFKGPRSLPPPAVAAAQPRFRAVRGCR
eukprot:s87_g29.t1